MSAGLVDLVTGILENGDQVRMSGLGIIEVKDRPARMGRNSATGATIPIAASKKVTFRVAKELKRRQFEGFCPRHWCAGVVKQGRRTAAHAAPPWMARYTTVQPQPHRAAIYASLLAHLTAGDRLVVWKG